MTTAPTPHLRALAEAVKGWSSCNEAWPHAEHFDVALVGGIYIPRPLIISVPVSRPTGHKEST